MNRLALGQVVNFTNGGTPSRSKPEFWDGSIPWITGADITEDGSISARSFISEAAVKASSTNVLPAGTVLLLTRTSVGKVGVLPEPMAINQDITAMTPSNRLDTRYLVHFLRSSRSKLLRNLRGATIKGVTRDDVASLELALPPLPEQRRIAAILDQADAVRAGRRQMLAHLHALSQSIFREMFGDPVSNVRGLPTAPIGALADVVTGNSPSRADVDNFGNSIEWIKSDNLGGEVATSAHEWLSEKGRRKARIASAGSILVTCIAGSSATIGKASLVDRDVAFNQQINAILPSAKVNAAFLLAQLKTAPGLVRAKSTGGMKGLVSKSAFTSIDVLAPPAEAQQAFASKVAAVANQTIAAQQARVADEELFAALQSRVFQGEL